MIKTKKVNLKLLPTPGYILIEPESIETKTASGLYLPENATGEKPQKGKVLAIGDEEMLENGIKRSAPANVGNIVIYKKWGGNDYKQDNKEYMFVKFEDILAIIK